MAEGIHHGFKDATYDNNESTIRRDGCACAVSVECMAHMADDNDPCNNVDDIASMSKCPEENALVVVPCSSAVPKVDCDDRRSQHCKVTPNWHQVDVSVGHCSFADLNDDDADFRPVASASEVSWAVS